MHVAVIGLFASIIGPFGGFFASGLKRSIKIKVKLILLIGFCKFNSWPRRSYRSDGLPSNYRNIYIFLPSLIHQNEHKHSILLDKHNEHSIKISFLLSIEVKFLKIWNKPIKYNNQLIYLYSFMIIIEKRYKFKSY